MRNVQSSAPLANRSALTNIRWNFSNFSTWCADWWKEKEDRSKQKKVRHYGITGGHNSKTSNKTTQDGADRLGRPQTRTSRPIMRKTPRRCRQCETMNERRKNTGLKGFRPADGHQGQAVGEQKKRQTKPKKESRPSVPGGPGQRQDEAVVGAPLDVALGRTGADGADADVAAGAEGRRRRRRRPGAAAHGAVATRLRPAQHAAPRPHLRWQRVHFLCWKMSTSKPSLFFLYFFEAKKKRLTLTAPSSPQVSRLVPSWFQRNASTAPWCASTLRSVRPDLCTTWNLPGTLTSK